MSHPDHPPTLGTAAGGELTLAAPPRITLATFARVLADLRSPAAVEAPACYAAGVARGIDPSVLLALFRHESQCGTDPNAVTITAGRNWGALRSGGRAYKVASGFAWYHTWADGADACAALLARYVARGLTTVEAAIPVYAPAKDRNTPAAYIAAVRADVARWQAAERALIDRRYVVTTAARLRAGPSRQSDIIRTLPAGLIVPVDHIIGDGEAVPVAGGGTSRRWAALTTGGFVHASLLRPHEDGR